MDVKVRIVGGRDLFNTINWIIIMSEALRNSILDVIQYEVKRSWQQKLENVRFFAPVVIGK